MAVLNPPSALPGLARSITNYLLTSRAVYDEVRLTALFAPPGISDGGDRTRGVDNTLKAGRAIGLITQERSGPVTVSEVVKVWSKGSPFTREEFRQVLRKLVLDMKRDGDPWTGDIEARTAGARDLSRALSWFLAQDALGPALSWSGIDQYSAQWLQSQQLRHLPDQDRPIVNDTRWGAFSRWAVALGFAEPAAVHARPAIGPATTVLVGLVPLPLRAIRDVVCLMETGRRPVAAFLDELTAALPVLDGGMVRRGLGEMLEEDPDPGVRGNAVDTSISQSLLILEDEGHLKLTYGADAEARVFTDPEGDKRVTSVDVMDGTGR